MIRHAFLSAWLVFAFGAAVQAACAPDTVSLRQDGVAVDVTVEVVDTPASRAQGLMHRESLPTFGGMLFVYERPQPVAFWMKNTLIPLDMIFADAGGAVQRIHANAVPHDLTAIPGGDAIQYVLEVNAGFAAMLGLGPGAEMRHPAIDQTRATWPCD